MKKTVRKSSLSKRSAMIPSFYFPVLIALPGLAFSLEEMSSDQSLSEQGSVMTLTSEISQPGSIMSDAEIHRIWLKCPAKRDDGADLEGRIKNGEIRVLVDSNKRLFIIKNSKDCIDHP